MKGQNNSILKHVDIEIANEYVRTGNGVQSVFKVFPKKTYNSADSYFRRLQKDARFQKLIEDSTAAATKKLDISLEYILGKLKDWLEADLTDFIGLSPDQLKQLPSEKRKLITSYKNLSNGSIEISIANKEKSIEMLARHVGLFEKDSSIKFDFTNVRVGFE